MKCKRCSGRIWCSCNEMQRFRVSKTRCLCCELYFSNKSYYEQELRGNKLKRNKFRQKIKKLTELYLAMYCKHTKK